MSPTLQSATRLVYTDADFISTIRAEAAVLLASGFEGALIRESPFEMRFPAAARRVTEQRRKRAGRFGAKEQRYFSKSTRDRM